MFSVGQNVLYGTNGVCAVADITTRKIGKINMEYYVLKPLCSQSSTLFVPTQNEQLVSRMRCTVTGEELENMLCSPEDTLMWNDNKIERTEQFKSIIAGARCDELIAMIRLIHRHADEVHLTGKHLHLTDERYLKEAEKMVTDELSVVLGIDREEALQRILS